MDPVYPHTGGPSIIQESDLAISGLCSVSLPQSGYLKMCMSALCVEHTAVQVLLFIPTRDS